MDGLRFTHHSTENGTGPHKAQPGVGILKSYKKAGFPGKPALAKKGLSMSQRISRHHHRHRHYQV
jgi:hypothetical protein